MPLVHIFMNPPRIITDLDSLIAQFSANVKAKFNHAGEW